MKNENLIGILRRETESLRVQYLAFMKEWADKEFARMIEEIEPFQVCHHAKEAIYVAVPYNHFDSKYPAKEWEIARRQYSSGESQKARRSLLNRLEKFARLVHAGKDAFIVKMEKLAEDHYEDSILKLAARIQAKELNESALQVKTAHIAQNIETVLTDGVQTVKAFTIIASGEVQKPHYRYLIK